MLFKAEVKFTKNSFALLNTQLSLIIKCIIKDCLKKYIFQQNCAPAVQHTCSYTLKFSKSLIQKAHATLTAKWKCSSISVSVRASDSANCFKLYLLYYQLDYAVSPQQLTLYPLLLLDVLLSNSTALHTISAEMCLYIQAEKQIIVTSLIIQFWKKAVKHQYLVLALFITFHNIVNKLPIQTLSTT